MAMANPCSEASEQKPMGHHFVAKFTPLSGSKAQISRSSLITASEKKAKLGPLSSANWYAKSKIARAGLIKSRTLTICPKTIRNAWPVVPPA
jgi:hypothetical protein